jgi:hypothetical protein
VWTATLALIALAAQAPSWEPLSALDGSLLFVCGNEPGTAELYFKDDAHAVRQLTVTQPHAGANSAGWLGDRILAVIDRRRLFAFTESRSSRSALLEVTRGARRSVPLKGRRIGGVAISSRRRVAYSSRGRFVAIMRLDGSRRRVFRREWAPLAWSPDGRRVLVGGQQSRIGLLNPRTGSVRRLGSLPCGYLSSAVWTRPGTHP